MGRRVGGVPAKPRRADRHAATDRSLAVVHCLARSPKHRFVFGWRPTRDGRTVQVNTAGGGGRTHGDMGLAVGVVGNLMHNIS